MDTKTSKYNNSLPYNIASKLFNCTENTSSGYMPLTLKVNSEKKMIEFGGQDLSTSFVGSDDKNLQQQVENYVLHNPPLKKEILTKVGEFISDRCATGISVKTALA